MPDDNDDFRRHPQAGKAWFSGTPQQAAGPAVGPHAAGGPRAQRLPERGTGVPGPAALASEEA